MTPTSPSMDAQTVAVRYDGTTILLHWLTALLVLALFTLAVTWGLFERDTRKQLQSLHISLGILLAVVLVVRIAWRTTRGRRLPLAIEGLQGKAARGMHYLLYALLALQVVLGFTWRWAQAESFQFFGLVQLQFATLHRAALDDVLGELHDINGWTIVILAGLHAAVALVHRYVLKDGVLQRMLGGSRA